MFNPRVEIIKRLEDVFSIQAFWDRLGHGHIPAGAVL